MSVTPELRERMAKAGWEPLDEWEDSFKYLASVGINDDLFSVTAFDPYEKVAGTVTCYPDSAKRLYEALGKYLEKVNARHC